VGTKVIVMPDVGVEPHVVDYLFAKIDKDGDGKLSIRELVTSLREDPSLAATLGLDFKNGTGEVDDDACAALEEWFNTYDSNGDKEFDKDEFYQIFVKRDDGPGPPSAGNTNDVSAEEAARRETHAAEIAAEIAQSIREATELERVKDTLSKREKEMEELKAQMVRLQTGGETTESAPSAPSDLDSSEAGDGDTTEESTPTSTPEKQSGVSGDVDVGDISKAKKLLGMSPPGGRQRSRLRQLHGLHPIPKVQPRDDQGRPLARVQDGLCQKGFKRHAAATRSRRRSDWWTSSSTKRPPRLPGTRRTG
jgi:hypothetical protein